MTAGGAVARARDRLGNRGRAGRACLARDRWVQPEHPYPAFRGGDVVGQWRPTSPTSPPICAAMSAQGLAFTDMFVLVNNTQFDPGPPRGLTSAAYTNDFNAVKALGRRTGSTRTEDQTALAPFWEGNASVHWNQAANQIARANHLSMSDSNRLLAVLNIAMADTAFTIWSAKRFYGADPVEVTWRPVTAIPLANTDGNPDTAPDPDWLPLVNTPSSPGIPRGPSQPKRRGGDGSPQPLRGRTDVHADDTRTAGPHVQQHRAGAGRREQRAGLGRHALSEHGRHQRRRGRGDRRVRQSKRHAAPPSSVRMMPSVRRA